LGDEATEAEAISTRASLGFFRIAASSAKTFAARVFSPPPSHSLVFDRSIDRSQQQHQQRCPLLLAIEINRIKGHALFKIQPKHHHLTPLRLTFHLSVKSQARPPRCSSSAQDHKHKSRAKFNQPPHHTSTTTRMSQQQDAAQRRLQRVGGHLSAAPASGGGGSVDRVSLVSGSQGDTHPHSWGV
jgi:hypothetical protein